MITRIQKILKGLPSPPPELKEFGDLVSWKATIGGAQIETSIVCYASLMKHLSDADIKCYAFPRGCVANYTSVYNNGDLANKGPLAGRLSPLQYARIMNSFRRSGILPEGIEYFSDKKKGHCLHIPPQGYDRHTVYMLLSFYRMVDSVPPVLWSLLNLQDALRKRGLFLPFLQILFYMLNEPGKSLQTSHSTPINARYVPGTTSLGRAWSFSKFYHMSLEERSKAFSKELRTDVMWRTLAAGIKSDVKVPAELLSPKLTPVFTHPEKFGPAELAELVKKV